MIYFPVPLAAGYKLQRGPLLSMPQRQHCLPGAQPHVLSGRSRAGSDAR